MVLVGWSVAGCGDATVTATTADGDDVTVVVSGDSFGMDAAMGRGGVAVVGECLGVGDTVVVWPEGTEVTDARELTVEVPGYGTFALGDEIELGGGETLGEDVASLPESCADGYVRLAN